MQPSAPRTPSRRRLGLAVVIALAGTAVAAFLWLREPDDPYLAHLEERIDALLPEVERELGAELRGPIRVVVSTRRELGELRAREYRALLTAIEGEPAPDVRDDVKWTVHGLLGMVDSAGTIHICRQEMEGAPHVDFVGRILDMGEDAGQNLGPELLDWTLVHELVHVFQKRVLESDTFVRRSRHRTDLLARRAVLEGHAEVVAARVLGVDLTAAQAQRSPPIGPPSDVYGLFDIGSDSWNGVFAYVHGGGFVDAAFQRLGPDVAVRRMLAEPPSVHQVEHPDTWPGPGGPDSVTDAMRLSMGRFLTTEWKEVRGGPRPPSAFLHLCGTASPETQAAAALALREVQRIEASALGLGRSLAGHLLSAATEEDAQVLLDAWGEAARARDDLVPSNPKARDRRVLASAWSEAEIDGRRVLLVRRAYRDLWNVVEHAVVARRGRHVLELRLVEYPGGAAAALRLARRVLACVVNDPGECSPDAPDWESRWRFACDPGSAAEHVRGLLEDSDADVRHAALTVLLRRGALSPVERDRARDDADPLVRLTALTWCGPDGDLVPDDLSRAIRDADPWVVAGGYRAAVDTYGSGSVPFEDLAAALQHPETFVRREAALLLAEWEFYPDTEEEWLVLVRQAMTDHDPGVRERARRPLLHIEYDTPGLVETVVDVLEGSDDDAKDDLLGALTLRERVPGVAHALVPLLDHERLCDDAVTVLGKMRDEALPAVPALHRVADDAEAAGDLGRRLAALHAIASITRDRTEWIDVVRDALENGTDDQAKLAAHSMEAADSWVRGRVRTQMKDLVPTLVRRLDTEDRFLKLAALGALRVMGRAGESALPAVRALRDRGDPLLDDAAEEAFRALQAKPARPHDDE